jgi:hypothetical protein
MTSGDQWITYENVDSAILKVTRSISNDDQCSKTKKDHESFLGTICQTRRLSWCIHMEY